MSNRSQINTVIASVALLLVASACGDDTTPAMSATPIDQVIPTSSTPKSGTVDNTGGYGAPAAQPGEFAPPGVVSAMVVDLMIDDRGCWYLSGNGSTALLVAPPATILGAEGDQLVTADGVTLHAGDRVDATGWFLDVSTLVSEPDSFWQSYTTFCDPQPGFAIVATTLNAAYDVAAADPEDLAGELAAVRFDIGHPCGLGFAAADSTERWSLRIDITTPQMPDDGPVSLPDDRFAVSVTTGAHLFANHCDDAVEWFEPTPETSAVWPVTSGSFDYPSGSGECAGPATITLQGAVVETVAGPVALEPIEITNAAFGCFAG